MIKSNKGFSLIELMIAMMIGLFLVFVVISSYATNKSSSTLRSELGTLQSNARIAMEFLRNGIEHAGYPSTYIHSLEKPFLTAVDGDISGYNCTDDGAFSFDAANIINNQNRHTKDGTSRDVITIAFMPDNPNDSTLNAHYWQDCAGTYAIDTASNSIQAQNCSADPISGQGSLAVVYNSYFINSNGLSCTTSRDITVPIAEGIDAIQYRYGVKTSDNIPYQIQYQDATAVEAANSWSNVVSVQVAMLVKSKENVKPADEQKHFLLLGELITRNDRRIRKVFTTVIHLVNKDR